MLSRVVYKKQRGRRLATALATVALISGSLFVASTALAVHDAGVFELDGNAVSGAAPGVDWDSIFAQAPNCAGTTACSFTHEADGVTIFTGGGSKDDLDTPKWKHKAGSVPDKDDLADAFAARYTVPGYDPDGPGPLLPPSDIIYFGADRTANSGDAFMGFWFFQGNVTALPGGTFGPGAHQDGDVLVITDFSGGGGDVDLAAYQWNGPGGTIPGTGAINNTLDELLPFGAADCLTTGGNDPACATVNDVAITSPWPYVDKTGSTQIRTGEFVEGGINLTFLGLGDECFSSFLAETRSSTSVNATLKDFVGGQFDVCNATLSTAPSAGAGGTVTPGTPVTDTATVVGSSASNTPTGTVTFSICGPTAVDSTALCTTGGNAAGTGTLSGSGGTATATSSPAVNTAASPLAPGRYCFRADWPGDSNYVGALTHAGTGNSECFIVTDTSSGSTAQNWRPNDSATFSSAGGTALAGSVTFTLYPNLTCAGTTVLYTETRDIVADGTGTASSRTVVTTNDGTAVGDYLASASGSFSWSAVFTSTNSVTGSTAPCESTGLTLDNDITAP